MQTYNSTYAYDPAGNRTLETDANGTLTTSTYDNANRPLLSVAWTPPSLVVTTTYTSDAAGHLTEIQAPTGNQYFSWDAAGNMTVAEPPAGLVTLSHDAQRRRVGKISTDGSQTRFVFDVTSACCRRRTPTAARRSRTPPPPIIRSGTCSASTRRVQGRHCTTSTMPRDAPRR